ncbi:MAG: cytochrome b N-terminal domain-containing protein [Desulfobulbaceae bacterium]|nr:cytochrome b N-terminal domain-containing protein [Desulfobulbaceae bacterium]
MKRFLTETKWGAMSLTALYISVISGIVVALQYDFSHPFYSAVSLDLLIPFGLYWRSLHFYSSQLFFLLSLAHLVAILVASSRHLSLNKWIWLIATVPVSLLLLFTGYVLRGDATGESAGHIAENICLSVPVIGDMLNSLLFAIAEEGMKRVYANHVIGLVVLWGIFAWDHLRRYRVRIVDHSWFVFFTVAFSLVFKAPMDLMRIGDYYISGPWFFLGLQELLRYVQPFWAGVVFPMLFLFSLAFLQDGHKWCKKAQFFAGGWIIFYCGATILALNH